jgi:predicted lipoprotein with Yx(FWY)xxD motif
MGAMARAAGFVPLFLVVALAACGGGSGSSAAGSTSAEGSAATGGEQTAAVTPASTGTTIVARSYRFGRMLFDSRRQAIYIFQRDSRNRTACYGNCARAWPPVLTRGSPRAGNGTRASLLGTIRRRDGTRQVTYAGKPLYHYVNEGPGQVLCHNVNLNGGFWWVIGPDGKRRP